MLPKKPLLLDNFGIPSVKENFIALSLITREDIKEIWCRKEDARDLYPNLGSICPENYNWSDPLYVKMIHRFNNCGCRVAQLYHQIDPGNQRLLLSRRRWQHRLSLEEIGEMMTFFAWMSNMLSMVDILDLEGRRTQADIDAVGRDVRSSVWVDIWKRNPIVFFYTVLPQEKCDQLVKRYNKVEIAAYNRICDERVAVPREAVFGKSPDSSFDGDAFVVYSMGESPDVKVQTTVPVSPSTKKTPKLLTAYERLLIWDIMGEDGLRPSWGSVDPQFDAWDQIDQLLKNTRYRHYIYLKYLGTDQEMPAKIREILENPGRLNHPAVSETETPVFRPLNRFTDEEELEICRQMLTDKVLSKEWFKGPTRKTESLFEGEPLDANIRYFYRESSVEVPESIETILARVLQREGGSEKTTV